MKLILAVTISALMLAGCATTPQKTAANICPASVGSTRLHDCETRSFGSWNGHPEDDWRTGP